MKEGNKYLKCALIQCAWALTKGKSNYFRSKYYSKLPKMGARKAICMIAHKLLINIYQVLKERKAYVEKREIKNSNKINKQINYHIGHIEKLGYSVNLKSIQAWFKK